MPEQRFSNSTTGSLIKVSDNHSDGYFLLNYREKVTTFKAMKFREFYIYNVTRGWENHLLPY